MPKSKFDQTLVSGPELIQFLYFHLIACSAGGGYVSIVSMYSYVAFTTHDIAVLEVLYIVQVATFSILFAKKIGGPEVPYEIYTEP
eukprot:14949982-Ditylum_brightwellii.AAC.1